MEEMKFNNAQEKEEIKKEVKRLEKEKNDIKKQVPSSSATFVLCLVKNPIYIFNYLILSTCLLFLFQRWKHRGRIST